MGVVYEATHARLAGRYAIKVLTLRLAESPEGIAQFDREARITSLLQHPNIVQVIDHNTTPDGTEYLVMEYLAGESLSQRLAARGSLPLDTVVGIVDQIAAGLSAAHASSASSTAISSRTTCSWSRSRAGKPSWSRSSTSVSRR